MCKGHFRNVEETRNQRRKNQIMLLLWSDGRVSSVAEAPNTESFIVLTRINLPVAPIIEAEEVKPKEEYEFAQLHHVTW
jgi:hypothetical protein